MLTDKTHQVLCVACQAPAATLHAYPERRCGVTAPVVRDGRRVIASCTGRPGNKDCEAGVHHDEYLKASFGAPMALRAGRQGQTGRA